MRLIKKFSLVALAAVGITMVAGASTALAEGSTAFCKAEETPCSKENLYGAGTVIEASTNERFMLFLTENFNIKCKSSSMEVELGQALGKPLEASILSYKFAECLLNGSSCTAKTTVPASISFLKTEVSEEVFLAIGTGTLSVSITCPLFSGCTIVASPFTLQVFATAEFEAAKLWVQEVLFERETPKLFCPELWEIDSILEISSPEPLYLSS